MNVFSSELTMFPPRGKHHLTKPEEKGWETLLSCWSGFSKRSPKYYRLFFIAFSWHPEVEVNYLLLKTPYTPDTKHRTSWIGTDLNALSLRASFHGIRCHASFQRGEQAAVLLSYGANNPHGMRTLWVHKDLNSNQQFSNWVLDPHNKKQSLVLET